MKKIITTLAIALILTAQVQAQSGKSGQDASKPAPDAKLISSEVSGNYRVATWLVKKGSEEADNEFSVKYKVNISRLISTYDNNHDELVKLRAFISGLVADGDNKISRINITGYASPDGTTSVNERLAKARASDCCTYLKNEYPLIAKTECITAGVAEPWSATADVDTFSKIPMKSEVERIIESDMTSSQKEAKLRRLSSSWDYMVESVLPKMRCVEIEVIYSHWERVVTRTPIKSQCNNTMNYANIYYIVIEQDPSQLVAFDSCAAPLDYKRCKRDRMKYSDKRRRAKIKEKYGREKYLLKSR